MGDCEYVNYDVDYYVDYDNHHYHEDGNALALMLRTFMKVSCQWKTGHEAPASNCGHLRSR